jgi:hypothetical protein
MHIALPSGCLVLLAVLLLLGFHMLCWALATANGQHTRPFQGEHSNC